MCGLLSLSSPCLSHIRRREEKYHLLHQGKLYVCVYTRVAVIQCLDASIYCFHCITIQRYITQYKAECKHRCLLLFFGNNKTSFPKC